MSAAARSALLRVTWVQHWMCKNSRDKLVWKLSVFAGERLEGSVEEEGEMEEPDLYE